MILFAEPNWLGGDVLRIRAAAASLIDSASRNLVIKGDPDCDAARYGFPRELAAKDFRRTAFHLANELLLPGSRPREPSRPAGYPATSSLPNDVKTALEWLANVYDRQMRFWGWHPDDDDDGYDRLVYQISPYDLDKLRRCLKRLDEALAWHPARPLVDHPEAPRLDATGDARPKTLGKRTTKRKRREGKSEQCIGMYMAYLGRQEIPPGPAEIAAKVGCDPGTASRAIKRWEDKRREMAREDARDRYRAHG